MTSQPSTPKFSTLGLNDRLLSRLKTLGYSQPTAVQADAIPAALSGRDLLASAKTGSGKTAAFSLPLLQHFIDQPNHHSRHSNPVFALILVPTRELAIQVGDSILTYAQDLATPPMVLSLFGGVKINPQMMALRGGADILVATPGRLLDLMNSNALSLASLHTLVLDEADKMLNLGFHDELNSILTALPDSRQNMLFSATFPDELKRLIRVLLNDPAEISIESLHTETHIQQRVITVNRERKNALLIHLIKNEQWQQVLVFCSAKHSCNRLAMKLKKAGLNASVFHGDQTQGARNKALQGFKEGEIQILIATDVAARGIDIECLPHVVNFELPRSPNDYIHRIGRTGRAGKSGTAISLICHAEYHHFKVIEKRIKQRLTREQIPGFEASETAPEERNITTPKSPTGRRKKHQSREEEPQINAHIWGNRKKY